MIFDFDNYVRIQIPEGMVKKITDENGNVLWKQGIINQVPISTDTDGSIFNGTGYMDNVRLSSSGGISSSAQNGSTTTGFIPFIGGDSCIIRMKGVRWVNTSQDGLGHYYIIFYDKNKTRLGYLSAGEYPSYTHVVTVTRDANGVESVVWNQDYGTSNSLLQIVRNEAAFIRINAYGKGADMIVTINEEIESSDSGDSGDSGDTGVVDFTWPSVAASIKRGTYATDYKIGDTVPLDLGAEGVVNMEIAAFDADELADGSGKAAISWISKELLPTTHRWNPARVTNDDGSYQEGTGTIGGWEKSELRTYFNDTLLPLIPSDVQTMIKPVSKTQDSYNAAGKKFTQTTDDAIWVPSYAEIQIDANKTAPDYSDLFSSSSALVKYVNTTKKNWWLRDAMSGMAVRYINTSGVNSGSNANTAYFCTVLGFCT